MLFATKRPRLFSIAVRARSSIGCATSTSLTLNPDCANTWAMPLPIVPAPMTPTVRMSISGSSSTDSRSRSHEGHEGHECFFWILIPRDRRALRCLREKNRSHPLDRERDAVAAAETERRDPALQMAVLQRVQQRRQHARSARSDRMAERDRAAVHVDLRGIDAELFQHGDGLDGERFVELEKVHVVQL